MAHVPDFGGPRRRSTMPASDPSVERLALRVQEVDAFFSFGSRFRAFTNWYHKTPVPFQRCELRLPNQGVPIEEDSVCELVANWFGCCRATLKRRGGIPLHAFGS